MSKRILERSRRTVCARCGQVYDGKSGHGPGHCQPPERMNEHEGRTFEQARAEIASRNVTAESRHEDERYALFRLCTCPSCEGTGKTLTYEGQADKFHAKYAYGRCPDCRGEGRTRDLIATCGTPEALGVAIVTLAREGEWEGCPIGILDTTPTCPGCGGSGQQRNWSDHAEKRVCPGCSGSGAKPTGDWLVRPWLPSARNITDAARTLAKSKTREKT